MKRIILGLAAAVGLCVLSGKASADPGGYVPPGSPAGAMPNMAQIAGPNTLLGSGDVPLGRAPDRYGLHPCLKKLFHVPTAGFGAGGAPYGYNPAAAGYGLGGPAYSQGGYPGVPMQGTLVFPYNNFMRSPRDYFMADVNK